MAFCPERISQGNGVKELVNLPQIISASDNKTYNLCAKIFRNLTPNIIKTNLKKQRLQNYFVWRYLKFAIQINSTQYAKIKI